MTYFMTSSETVGRMGIACEMNEIFTLLLFILILGR